MMVEHPHNGRRHHADAARTSRPPRTKVADLVLSGGGVKGIGLVGAVVALMEAGYRIGRISGTSAGSLVGAGMAGRAPSGRAARGALQGNRFSLPPLHILVPRAPPHVPLVAPR